MMKSANESTTLDPALAMEMAALSKRRLLDETIAKGDSDIQKFYENSSLFVTGGSGFLGKQMIEKLLRSCKIKKIFMLLRTKKGKTPEERLLKIFDDPVYDVLKKIQPDFVNKLVAVSGDLTEPKLGLTDRDWLAITQEVDIIIHGAATINFDEPLKVATIINIRGTREVLLFAKQFKKLRSLVHISTAYCHATRDRCNTDVMEKFYPAPVPPGTMIELAESVDEETLHKITPTFIQTWPNTYSYTKAIAEELVRSMADDLPVCIVRPAIVICCIREPSPGWIDRSNVFGPSGVPLGVGLGVLHVLHADSNLHIDLVCADQVNNAIIAAGWETARKREAGMRGEPTIYTVTSKRNPMKIAQFADALYKMRPLATSKAVWYCWTKITKCKFWALFLTWTLHFIPAYIIDTVMRIMGKKPQFVKLCTRTFKLLTVFSFFVLNEFNFGDKNLSSLYDSMSQADKEIYDFDISKIDRYEQVFLWCLGIRKYVVKDNLMGTDYGVKKQKVFKVLNYIVLTLYAFLGLKILQYVFYGISSVGRSVLY